MKKVILKLHDDGRLEIISKDPEVVVFFLLPDGSEVEITEKPEE